MKKNSEPIYISRVDNPIITIAIPTYKRSDLLYEAVQSALNQETSINYDIVVVDNNPERGDETEQVMEFFRNNTIVSYFKNLSNLGMVGNWNQLFNIAEGKWVAMLHDDDLLYSNYVEVIYQRMLEIGDASIIVPSYEIVTDRQIVKRITDSCYNYINKICAKSFIVGNVIGPPIGMLVNREFFIKNLRFDTSLYPSIDWDFYIESTRFGNLYKISDKLCLYYIGVNESLKENTIIGFFKNARDINRKLSSLLKFPHNIINKLCYRNLIVNTIKWTSKISDAKVISKAMRCIGYKRNKVLESISILVSKLYVHIISDVS